MSTPRRDSQESILVTLSIEVIRALEALPDPWDCSAFVERAIRRELASLNDAAPVRPVGRPRKHSVEDLVGCLGLRTLTTGEFCKRAYEQLDISRATFYRLLGKGRKEWRFRQSAIDDQWQVLRPKRNG
jgi:hypothetical protein